MTLMGLLLWLPLANSVAAPLPKVVACAVMGNEALHAREWVEYHLAIGVSRIYLAHNPGNASDETQSGLKGMYSSSVVKITNCADRYPEYTRAVYRVEPCQVPTCTVQVAADFGISGPGTQSKHHVWIMMLDMDEYITLISPMLSLPEVLSHYEQQGKHSLILQKAWFGSGSSQSENCIAAPLLARFTHYGTEQTVRRYRPTSAERKGRNSLNNITASGKSANTLHVNWGAAKPAFSTMVMPELVVNSRGASQIYGTHYIAGLLSRTFSASVQGTFGLLLSHFKPQSLEEFLRKISWNSYLQNKEFDGHSDSSNASALAGQVSRFRTMRLHTNGGTHALFLTRLPKLCKQSPAIAEGLHQCNMSTLCLDCIALKRLHQCAAENVPMTRRHDDISRGVMVTGQHRMRVMAALKAENFSLPIKVGPPSRLGPRSRLGFLIVHTDTTDVSIICSTACNHLSFLDPLHLDFASIAALVKLSLVPRMHQDFPQAFPFSGRPCIKGNSISQQR
eukprot:CAMPEP_0119303556 /NCGR_PEP_ID=MMETSP1333-20130426/4970_1 /TAXON_ID=418940 /ORGANISM="Scyphosphaera apsteinii, Strain RCC1455" /LENGTH=506 /DNA_ID=CAMNT_0007306265 /DNA_START=99 /DNA_END=1615 /DNA_ORIENTATION=+